MKNSYKIRHLSVILMLLLALSLSGCRTKNLISPVVFKIPSTIPDEKIAKAVKKASIKRNWIPFDEKDGVISVRLEVRQHIVEVDIEYRDHEIQIVYRDSENMRYKKRMMELFGFTKNTMLGSTIFVRTSG